MVNYLKADNYGSLVNFKIDFSAMNILLGENGTGKSTIFSLLLGLRCFILGKADVSEVFTFDTLTRWQLVPAQAFEFSLSYNENEYIYQLEIDFNRDEKNNRVKNEIVLCNGNPIFKAENGKAILFNDSYKEGPELLMNWNSSGVSSVYERSDNKKLCEFKKAVEKIIVCHPLPLENYSVDSCLEKKTIDYYTDNIHNAYLAVLQERPEKMLDLWQVLKDINPCFSRTYLKGESDKVLYFEYVHNGVKSSYSISEISDGERMLFILYFLIVVYFDDDCSLFLDEPDNYISLQEVGQFLQFVQDKASHKKQCVIISHHPNVIDFLAPSNGIWLERRSYGATMIGKPLKNDIGLTYSEIISQGGMHETE